ncbi:fructose-6-phosphate aldolase [Pararoseomonas indoligenes]|uniref:Probable transaldolase n=1 Tax=Roseomonas indoligenes TaxID=2820811 RepID=A0A940N1Q2_9PROT|nr:fructose-6-phosphate aldolase [Pararoseomonas indoligenes]MBP0494431.1 fructose-6-phosphate aldolase [Pararoseomonas indoligenes]
MKFFVDTADVSEIRALAESGLLDGVTTNPSLIAKAARPMAEVIKEICDITPGPVSAEVTATDYDGMMREGEHLGRIAPNVVIKLPLTEAGLRACKHMVNNGVMVNVTLCFSPAQALLAGKAGATYISPFVGRLDDIGQNGMELIADIMQIYENYDAIRTEVLVASIRHPIHLIQAAKLGAHVATLPPAVIKSLYKHPLTDKGLESFLADWKKTGQSIL